MKGSETIRSRWEHRGRRPKSSELELTLSDLTLDLTAALSGEKLGITNEDKVLFFMDGSMTSLV
jgi:hypothetical protein